MDHLADYLKGGSIMNYLPGKSYWLFIPKEVFDQIHRGLRPKIFPKWTISGPA